MVHIRTLIQAENNQQHMKINRSSERQLSVLPIIFILAPILVLFSSNCCHTSFTHHVLPIAMRKFMCIFQIQMNMIQYQSQKRENIIVMCVPNICIRYVTVTQVYQNIK